MVDLIDSVVCGKCPETMRNACREKHISCIEYDSAYIYTKKALKTWLSSFNTSSATKCFEAVNLLKQRLEGEDEYK